MTVMKDQSGSGGKKTLMAAATAFFQYWLIFKWYFTFYYYFYCVLKQFTSLSALVPSCLLSFTAHRFKQILYEIVHGTVRSIKSQKVVKKMPIKVPKPQSEILRNPFLMIQHVEKCEILTLDRLWHGDQKCGIIEVLYAFWDPLLRLLTELWSVEV